MGDRKNTGRLARTSDDPAWLAARCGHCTSSKRARPTTTELGARGPGPHRAVADMRHRMWECGECGMPWERVRGAWDAS